MDVGFVKHVLFWLFVPSLATKLVVRFLYAFLPFFNPHRSYPGPQKAHRSYEKHHNVVYCLIIASYLVYSFIEIQSSLSPSYYTYLNIEPKSFSAKALKSNYRSLSLQFHPDKIASDPTIDPKTAEETYMMIKKGYEVLKNPLTRKLYDKFGDSYSSCTTCKLEKDYLFNSLIGSMTFYIGSFSFIMSTSFLGRFDYGRYWRYTLLVLISAFELALLLQDSPLDFVGDDDTDFYTEHHNTWQNADMLSTGNVMNFLTYSFLPNRPRFEKIILLHQMYMIVVMAISQIGPTLFPHGSREEKDKLILDVVTDEMERVAAAQTEEMSLSLAGLFKPLSGKSEYSVHSTKEEKQVLQMLRKNLAKVAAEQQLLEKNSDLAKKLVSMTY